MMACGGRDIERDPFNHPGGYKTILSKNTVGGACKVVVRLSGKSITWVEAFTFAKAARGF